MPSTRRDHFPPGYRGDHRQLVEPAAESCLRRFREDDFALRVPANAPRDEAVSVRAMARDTQDFEVSVTDTVFVRIGARRVIAAATIPAFIRAPLLVCGFGVSACVTSGISDVSTWHFPRTVSP